MAAEETARAERRRRLLILGALWASLVVVLVLFRSVAVYFASAALIAYLVAPLVSRISGVKVGKRALPRWGSILVIYALFFLLAYLTIIALVPQLYRELVKVSRDAVSYANSLTPERVRQLSREAELWLNDNGLPVDLSSRALEGSDIPPGTVPQAVHPAAWSLSVDLEDVLHDSAAKARSFIGENLGDIVSISRKVVSGVLTAVFMLFLMLMLAAYMSIDAAVIKDYARTLIPPDYAGDARQLLGRIDRSLSGVVRGQVLICLVNGVLTFVGLIIFGVKFAFLLATVAALLSLIPIFGSILSSVPIVAIALSQSWKMGFAMLAWIIGIHALEAYLLNPKIMGTAARIHPIVVVFALVAGERSFGLVGALFAVPIAGIFAASFDFARQKAQPPAQSPPSLHEAPKQLSAGG
ncbi:MAG: AI-2E family transporter [Myxococcales bacterium]|nr:AI-2E family transporter [Myxococcales bacterium]